MLELIGQLLMVPDPWWGFHAENREEHPGACIACSSDGFASTLLKGTDRVSARYRVVQVLIEPSESNGLHKTTSFAIKPVYFSTRKVSCLVHDRFIGKLDSDDLLHLQTQLAECFELEN